jgi:nuclear inhibitor of protein phosphatase 1
MMGISKDENFPKKRRKIKITFNEEEEVINPEDIDPSVGRFRNMVTTTIIPIRYRYRISPVS